jgi:hypothetical protein
MTSNEPCVLHFRRVWKTDSQGHLVQVDEMLPYDERYDVALQMRLERERKELQARVPHHHHLLQRYIRSPRR